MLPSQRTVSRPCEIIHLQQLSKISHHLSHQHIQLLADQVLLLQSTVQHVHRPALQDSTAAPFPLNPSSSTTSPLLSKRLQSRSYSQVASHLFLFLQASCIKTIIPHAIQLQWIDPNNWKFSFVPSSIIKTVWRLFSLLRSPSAPTTSPSTKIRPQVEPMASLTVEVPLSDEAQADPSSKRIWRDSPQRTSNFKSWP